MLRTLTLLASKNSLTPRSIFTNSISTSTLPYKPVTPIPFRPRLTIGNDICHSSRIARILLGRGLGARVREGKEDRERPEGVEDAEGEAQRGRKRRKKSPAIRFLARILIPLETRAYAPRLKLLDVLEKSRSAAAEAGLGPRWRWNERMPGEMAVLEDERKVDEESVIGPVAEFLAGRFAAKEAVMKAYRSRALSFGDIAILPGDHVWTVEAVDGEEDSGDLTMEDIHEESTILSSTECDNNTSTAFESKRGPSTAPRAWIKHHLHGWLAPREVLISISHDGGFATAVCLADADGMD